MTHSATESTHRSGTHRSGTDRDGSHPDSKGQDTTGSNQSQGPRPLRIRILGPMEISGQGEDRTPSAPMARRLLAALLLHANEQVRTSTLIDELWDGEPPRLARKTIQTYVYQLRKPPHPAVVGTGAGGIGERVETCPNGYRIRLAPDELDLWQFERHLARARVDLGDGDPESAARRLRVGLALWRGDAFADIETGPALAARVAQLADARLGAVELRVEADLRLGRHHRLMGELRQLTADHPLNEEFAAQFMLAAYRSGQRGTALETFGQLRRDLVDELGIEPSHRLQRLQRDVLNEAPALDLAPDRATAVRATDAQAAPAAPEAPGMPAAVLPVTPVIAQLPADTPDFVGRRAELARIVTHAKSGSDPLLTAPQVVTVLGQAGSGKSTVTVRAAHLLREHFADGQFHVRLHDENDRPTDPAAALRSLLRDIGMRVYELPDQVDELARIFRSWSADRSLLLVLDDAYGPEQVLPLLPGGSLSAVLVTSRVRLPGLPGAANVELGPMETDDAVELLASLAGADRVGADVDAARQTVRLTGNLALGVRAVGEKLAARRMWSVTELAARLAPENHRLAELGSGSLDVLGRLAGACARLAEPDSQALAGLAGAGAVPFDIPRAARTLAMDTWAAELLVGRLLDHHVVEIAESAPGAATVYRIPELLRLVAQTHAHARDMADAELRLMSGTPLRAGQAAVPCFTSVLSTTA
ncbi:BTAD domain-containing putative transcriptional regulator [Streptomyces niveus]|uniref:AfsR/SARP family transcriptional regulator n=1 Tax=Streptomyces niveus TaxID=193462 RepID=UPI00386CC6F1|nr:BTAD domain-containing putative transcriptional regulator [Streptomyces niveus]